MPAGVLFETNLKNALQRLANAVKLARTQINGNAADLSSLTTTAKSNLVAAINEVKAQANAAGSGVGINDTTPSTSQVYSSSKTDSQIASARAALKTEILGGAAAAYDTLQELVTYINSVDSTNDSEVAALVTAVGNRIRFDGAQTLTAGQKVQANDNIGSVALAKFGDPEADFDAVVVAALA